VPWKASCVMNERMKFLGDYLRRDRSLSLLCREYGISRKTGYKWIHRYVLDGPVGLFERSRAPQYHPDAVSEEVVERILRLREEKPRRGPRKLRAWLREHEPDVAWPSISSIGRILARHGKIIPRVTRRRTPPYTRPFQQSTSPNAVWCADFKGWFRTGDGQRCEPLTVTDSFSRYLLACRILPRTTQRNVREVFDGLFRVYGLPWAIRTDNGSPFAGRAIGGLSRLAVWWIKLGILPERIEPGCPQQNGRHERFHRTLKDETASPPKASLIDQQQAFDCFRRDYNEDRHHQALGDVTPGKVYHKSNRPYLTKPPEMVYPDHMIIRKVKPSGQVWWQGKEFHVSETLVGEPVAFEPINDGLYQLYYGPVKLAVYDEKARKLIKPKNKPRKQT
jgi:putative transposase